MLTDTVGTAIDSFEIGNDGSLSVGVARGILSVAGSEDFEAWSIVGPEKERVVSTPGGELALWL